MKDERDWVGDVNLLRRHYPNVDPASLTIYQFINLLASIDPALIGPIVHIAKLPK